MVKRYYTEMDVFETCIREVEDPTGAYVQYDDYAALEAEVVEVTNQLADAVIALKKSEAEVERLKEEK